MLTYFKALHIHAIPLLEWYTYPLIHDSCSHDSGFWNGLYSDEADRTTSIAYSFYQFHRCTSHTLTPVCTLIRGTFAVSKLHKILVQPHQLTFYCCPWFLQLIMSSVLLSKLPGPNISPFILVQRTDVHICTRKREHELRGTIKRIGASYRSLSQGCPEPHAKCHPFEDEIWRCMK